MSTQDVQDVDFKEVTESKMIDSTKQEVKPKHRILHVQVQGNPSSEDLLSTAQAFEKALQSGSSSVVSTTPNVQTFHIYGEGEAPFNGVLVRGAITLEDIARTIHDAEMAYSKQGFKYWFDLADDRRREYVKLVKNELRGITTTSDDQVKNQLVYNIVTALKSCLPAPQLTNLIQAKVWNGSQDYESDDAWTTIGFPDLKKGHVWINPEESPVVYRHCQSDSYVNYDGGTSFVTVDVLEVVPCTGTIEDKIVLQWKPKALIEHEVREAFSKSEESADAELLAQANEARDEGFAPDEEVQALQDSLVLSDEDSKPAGEEVLKPFSDTSDAVDQPQTAVDTNGVEHKVNPVTDTWQKELNVQGEQDASSV